MYFYMSNFWGKLPRYSSFHGNQTSGINGEKSRTKRSIDIPNGYISEQNGIFKVSFTKFYTKSWYKKFLTLIYLKLLISPMIHVEHNKAPSWSILSLCWVTLVVAIHDVHRPGAPPSPIHQNKANYHTRDLRGVKCYTKVLQSK